MTSHIGFTWKTSKIKPKAFKDSCLKVKSLFIPQTRRFYQSFTKDTKTIALCLTVRKAPERPLMTWWDEAKCKQKVMFQKHRAQITPAETQTPHTYGFSNGKQQHGFSSQNINFMSPCDSEGKQKSVMLWANTGMTVLIVADEKRTKSGQRGCSAHLWLRRHKIIEIAGKNVDYRGEENYSDVTRESYCNSNRNIEKREPQSLRTITLKIKVRL